MPHWWSRLKNVFSGEAAENFAVKTGLPDSPAVKNAWAAVPTHRLEIEHAARLLADAHGGIRAPTIQGEETVTAVLLLDPVLNDLGKTGPHGFTLDLSDQAPRDLERRARALGEEYGANVSAILSGVLKCAATNSGPNLPEAQEIITAVFIADLQLAARRDVAEKMGVSVDAVDTGKFVMAVEDNQLDSDNPAVGGISRADVVRIMGVIDTFEDLSPGVQRALTEALAELPQLNPRIPQISLDS